MILESRKWLKQFQRRHCEKSFTQLVNHFSSMVYSTALRVVGGDSEAAKDVTQTVFIDLARKAGSLTDEVMLGGWLHRHTFFVASKWVRSERRRRDNESKSLTMDPKSNSNKEDYDMLAPVLDDAVNSLSETDRSVILLRFYQEMNYQEIGSIVGTSEDATRMRVKRALEKLQSLLARKGVTISTSALGVTLSTYTLQAVPATLGSALATTALAGAATQTGILNQIYNMFQLTQIKAGLAGAVVTAAVVAPVTIQQQNQKAEAVAEAHQSELEVLQKKNADLETQVASAAKGSSMPSEQFRELLRLRGEVGPLREQMNALETENQMLKQEMMAFQKEVEKEVQTQLNQNAEEEEVRRQGTEKMNVAKYIVLGSMYFSQKNDGLFPKNMDEALSELDMSTNVEMAEAIENWSDRFDLIFQGKMEALAEPAKMIVIQEKEPWQGINGKWAKTYGFGDGHSEIHFSEDGNFSEWEQERAPAVIVQ